MAELKEVFDMVTKQNEPDLDSWKEQEDRQRKSVRNRRIGGFAVAAAIVAIAVVAAALSRADQGTVATTPPPDVPPQTKTLSIIDVGSGEETAFTAPAGSSDFEFTLDGSMITYSDFDENANAQVFVMDADGSNARQLTHGEGGVGLHGGPSWSPDGSKIAYERQTADNPQIFIVGVSDGVSTRVTTEPRGAGDAAGWTPDGGSIVFSTPNPSIEHMSALSLDLATGRTRLIVADASGPELSPDGAWIAFNSWLKPQVRLILANSDGSERRTIARFDISSDGFLRWSPDSTQIAYFGSTVEDGYNGNRTYVYDLATGETRFVTDGRVECWIDDQTILVSGSIT